MQELLAQLSVSARYFPSAVDAWLSCHVDASTTPSWPSIHCHSINQSSLESKASLGSSSTTLDVCAEINQRYYLRHSGFQGEGSGESGCSLDANCMMVSLSYTNTPSYLVGLSMPTAPPPNV